MKRRSFIENAGVVTVGALITNPIPPMQSKYKLGYQLFSVNQDMHSDTLGTLKALRSMGYKDFEIYGFAPDQITYYGLPAAEFRSMLDDLGLTASSGHYGFNDYLLGSEDQLIHFVDQCIEGARILGTPYITWPWLAPELRTMATYQMLAGKLNLIGEQVRKAGLLFAYHNHGFEFENHNGQYGYDIILRDTDPELVKLQIDMYWVCHSSLTYTPQSLVELHPGRFVMWHIKDMDAKTRDYTELGKGSINYRNVLPDPELSGLQYYYIEQGGNFRVNALQSARDSAIYLQANLLDKL